MKRVLIFSLIIISSFITTTGNAQVYIHAKVGFGLPVPGIFCPPPPRVIVYNDPYTSSPGYYQQQECERRDINFRGRGYEKSRYYDRYDDDHYYDHDRRRHDREHYDHDDRDYDHDHGRGWKHHRNW